MIPTLSAIIYAVLAVLAAGAVTAYLYERKLYREAYRANEDLSDRLDACKQECSDLRIELARIEGVAQGRECDAMQRKFLESMQENGQGTIRLGRRQQNG